LTSSAGSIGARLANGAIGLPRLESRIRMRVILLRLATPSTLGKIASQGSELPTVGPVQLSHSRLQPDRSARNHEHPFATMMNGPWVFP
jgi:hypothetical protein